MLPLIWRITTAEQMIKMSMVDFIFTDVVHVANLFTQIGIDFQTLQSGLFVCFPEDGCRKCFMDSNCARRNLNSCLGKISVAENEKPVLVCDICKDFVYD